ncbi:short chain dehydrogenase [Chitinophaga japonensis]|uniref:NADP-dependent 3-hydroxy acid dehydrogenase YdfG n=1 Tax=Chitinophaga japonensis TaxID=104662 RepID=A0A562SS72_CHIJA|nr:short chain dehydrogenase [Chitinophaga japonensis]TWI84095.1 NADP-dependent 3-hydroxy acid dehydrogenase YdfG [Chitinophaga japonensis]
MKILLVGATGAIGRQVKAALEVRHEVITAGRSSGNLQVDIADAASIEHLFKQAPALDACIVTAGSSHMESFQTLREESLLPDIRSKLLGQVNLVLIGQHYLNDRGSFTLTSGILADEPARGTAAASVVSGAIHSFGMAAAAELQRNLRINVVSPGLAADSYAAIGHLFPGFNPVPMQKLVNAYLKSVEGVINGQVIRVYE